MQSTFQISRPRKENKDTGIDPSSGREPLPPSVVLRYRSFDLCIFLIFVFIDNIQDVKTHRSPVVQSVVTLSVVVEEGSLFTLSGPSMIRMHLHIYSQSITLFQNQDVSLGRSAVVQSGIVEYREDDPVRPSAVNTH